MHEVAKSFGKDEPLAILHVGDYDPSGEVMFEALRDDVWAFAKEYGTKIIFARIALDLDQIEEYGLPTAPPKEGTHQGEKRDADNGPVRSPVAKRART